MMEVRLRVYCQWIGLGTAVMMVVFAWYFSKQSIIIETKNNIGRKTAKQEKTGDIEHANKTLVHTKGCANRLIPEPIQNDQESYGEEKKKKETNKNIYIMYDFEATNEPK